MLVIIIFMVRALIIVDDSCHGSEIVPEKCNRHDQCSKVKRFDVHIIEEVGLLELKPLKMLMLYTICFREAFVLEMLWGCSQEYALLFL